jgi:putative membrane protein
MIRRSVNPARVAEGGVALLSALLLFWLAATKAYQQYVTPRTLPYLYFAAAVLAALAALDFARMFETTHVRRYTHLLALLIPFVLLAASVNVKGLWGARLFPADADAGENKTLASETYTMKADGYAGRVLHGFDATQQTLTVADSEMFFWLTEVYTDPTPFLGFTVTTEGQVMNDAKHFPQSDCFSPVRKLMTCCVADLYSVGFKCQFAQAQALSANEWVRVTGKLIMADMGGGAQELRILADSVTSCDPPDEPYVYAY